MADPFLSAHKIAPRCFDISGRFQPAGIRDQMIRAFLLADKLFDTGHLNPGDRVLVVGAGAAGATAGVHAANRGTHVRIIDKAPKPFSLQSLSDTRWVDPTQYDWPLPHWREGRFPWLSAPELPMYWSRGPASELAAIWTTKLHDARRRHGDKLRLLCSTTFLHFKETDPSRANDPVCAVIKDRSGISFDLFEAVLFCHGFGNEIASIAGFSGIPFWSREDRTTLPTVFTSGATLIVGGGDGALQDFLLEATGLATARDVFDAVFPGGDPETEREIHAMEDQACRAALWAATPQEDHSILAKQEAVASSLAARALKRPPVVKALTKLLAPRLPEVAIAHSCNHFGRVYAFNRFLVTLLVQFLGSRGATARLDGTMVDDIRTTDDSHRCDHERPDLCFGHSHRAIFRAAGCAPRFERPHEDRVYQRIVIRRGVHAAPPITIQRANGALEAVTLRSCRQALPYYPPEKLAIHAE